MKPIGLIARDNGPLIGYDRMKESRKIKASLKRLTHDDGAYYGCLARYEIGHFDQIATVAIENKEEPAAMAERVLAGLRQELNVREWEASEAAPVDNSPRKAKSKLHMKFNSEEAFEEIRGHLRILTGNDECYQSIMRRHNFEKPTDIPHHDAGIPVYKALCVERNRIQMERETLAAAAKQVGPDKAKELLTVLKDAYETLGAGVFFGVLDKWGCPTIDEAIRSYNLGNIMKELERINEERKQGK
jgi:hypothetical protein